MIDVGGLGLWWAAPFLAGEPELGKKLVEQEPAKSLPLGFCPDFLNDAL